MSERVQDSKKVITKGTYIGRNSSVLLAVQFLLAFAACEFAFTIVEGASAGLHARPVLVLTVLFVLTSLLFGAGRPAAAYLVDTAEVTSLVFAAGTGTIIAALVRFILPSAGLELGAIVVAGLSVFLINQIYRLVGSSIRRISSERRPDAQRTIVVGSGNAARSLIRVIHESHNFKYRVVGCVDDEILERSVSGKRILGAIDDLPALIEKKKIQCVIIAIPSASPKLVKRVIAKCSNESWHNGDAPAVKILPGMLELLNDGAQVSRIRTVQPEDLLPREPVNVDLSEIAPHVENRVILVTGAGGSIGSELCRQIVNFKPSLLLLLGHGENSLFAINEELNLKFGFNRTKIILADVADASRIRNVFSVYRPHVVFHAAAHKHVPIVEANICEAARNNVLGTHVVALAAAAAGAAKFVLLSTDKAVNPTSVMGATKRLSEIISQSFANQTGTEFVTVRFGNVLESRGSVIPVFKQQIQNGGPLTVTHRDMQRYFMTIPEAVSLVLQAMAIGRDGQVLVLDMGKPINILKLAETLITLSGLTPYRDIAIVETGIRPGEKLFEEILTRREGMSTTSHSRLFIAQQERVPYETLAVGLRTLESAIKAGDQNTIVDVLHNFIPSYRPGAHILNGGANGKVFGEQPAIEAVGDQRVIAENGKKEADAIESGYAGERNGVEPAEVAGS